MDVQPVYIAKCQNYSIVEITRHIEEGIKTLYGNESLFKAEEKLLLKPNLLSDAEPEKVVTTHPTVVEAIGKILQKKGCTVELGDAPGASLVRIEKLWKMTGMDVAAKNLNSKLVNFSSFGVKTVSTGVPGIFSELSLSSVYDEYSGIVNLPKIKTHGLMGFTGAVKNLYGFLPGFFKVTCHKRAPKPMPFAHVLVSLYNVIKPRLTIVDGIIAMEGHGPQAGDPNKLGVIIIGKDLITVDVVIAYLMGINHQKDPTFTIFKSLGIPVPTIDEIPIFGANVHELKPKKFKLANSASLSNMLPGWMTKLAGHFLWIYPEPDKEKCTVCGLCKKACPVAAIEIEPEVAVVDRSKCIGCFCCTELCPCRAIPYDYSWLAKRLIKME